MAEHNQPQGYSYYVAQTSSGAPTHSDDSNSVVHRSLSEPRPQSVMTVEVAAPSPPPASTSAQINHIQLTQSNFTSPEIYPVQQPQVYITDPRQYLKSRHQSKIMGSVHDYYVGQIAGNSVETYDNLSEHNASVANHQSRIESGRYVHLTQPSSQTQNQFNDVQYNYFDRLAVVLQSRRTFDSKPNLLLRYNNSMRPIYNSVRLTNNRDIKSVDRDPIYAQVLSNGQQNGQPYAGQQPATVSGSGRSNVIMGLGGHKQSSHKHRQSLLNVPFVDSTVSRDIRSCEREYTAQHPINPKSHKIKSRNNTEIINNGNIYS